MPNMNVSFNGATLILPGAYEGDVPSGVNPNANAAVPPLIVIGYSYGGAPYTPYGFSSVQAFQAFLRGGQSTSIFAPVLANPSPNWSGAQEIIYINACESTQSSTTLSASANASGACPIAAFTSANFGLPSNNLQISATPVFSGKGANLTLYDGYSGATITGTNVGVPLQVSYEGAGSGGVISVLDTNADNIPDHITITDTGTLVATLAIGPSGYNLVSDLVNYLNGITDFSALILGDATLPLVDLDLGTYTMTGSGASAIITAGFNGPIYWANQYCSNYITAARAAGADVRPTTGTAVFVSVASQHFSGATSTPPILQDYANCFNAALNVSGWAVICDTSSAAVNALASAHVTQASSTLVGKGRRYFTGGQLGETVSQAAAAAQALANKFVVYAHPGISVQDPTTGVTTLYGGYMAGAAAAAVAVGNDVAQPLTNQPIQAVGVETALSTTDIDTLQQAGVMPIAITNNDNIPRFISDFTTWQSDANPLNVFTQQIACRLWLAYSLVNAARPYVGTVADTLDETRILNSAKKCLNALVRTSANNANAVLASWDTSSLQLVYTGAVQTAAISVNVTLVGQNRFITILVPVQTYSGTTTLAST